MMRRSRVWIGLAAIALAIALVWGQTGQADHAVATTSLPSGAIAQSPDNEIPTLTAPVLPAISGTYEDPQGTFQIGILEGYRVSTVGGAPLFQSERGDLAYSVVRVPLNSANPLSDVALVEIARQTLANGEGFRTHTFSSVTGGGLQIDWSGRLSQGAAPPEPISGRILARQREADVYLVITSAFDAAAPQLTQILDVLSSTLTIL
jgi:hypothetical protein